MFGRAVVRHAALIVAFGLAVTGLASASWAAPVTPIPVKDKPTVTETAPTANGAWFGWARDPQGKPDHFDFYVQRGTRARVMVNAAGTQGLGGAIVGDSVYYRQQRRDNPPQILRFDLRTGHRSSLPPKVNDHLRPEGAPFVGGIAVSGPWLLYEGIARGQFGPRDTVMLYNRVTHRQRLLTSLSRDVSAAYAGQVDGNYATYLRDFFASGDNPPTEVARYNIETKRAVTLPRTPAEAACAADPACSATVWKDDPAVSSDGTVYYFLRQEHNEPFGPVTSELWRQPIGGPAEAITTPLTSENNTLPGDSYVKDRSDGSRVVFFSWEGDIYKVVDDPQAAAAP